MHYMWEVDFEIGTSSFAMRGGGASRFACEASSFPITDFRVILASVRLFTRLRAPSAALTVMVFLVSSMQYNRDCDAKYQSSAA